MHPSLFNKYINHFDIKYYNKTQPMKSILLVFFLICTFSHNSILSINQNNRYHIQSSQYISNQPGLLQTISSSPSVIDSVARILQEIPSQPISGQSYGLQIAIKNTDIPTSTIQQYLATQTVYPNVVAKIPQPDRADLPQNQNTNSIDKIKATRTTITNSLNNDRKQIEWKVPSINKSSDFLVENDIIIELKNSQPVPIAASNPTQKQSINPQINPNTLKTLKTILNQDISSENMRFQPSLLTNYLRSQSIIYYMIATIIIVVIVIFLVKRSNQSKKQKWSQIKTRIDFYNFPATSVPDQDEDDEEEEERVGISLSGFR